MAMLSFGGIDVSKDRLDVMLLPEAQSSSVSNDAAGWANLVEQLRGSSIAAIGIEASGGYERGVTRALLAAGMPVRQVNPFKLRQFARASGILAKNDPLDARMIASFVAVMPTRPARRQAVASERLVQMLAVRRQLSAEKIAAENASRLLEDPMLQRLSRRRIARLAADIELLDKRLVEIVATDATLRLLTSMPGVGPVLACTLIALLPELGGMSRKQVAALVGVAPYAFESGTLKGRRCIWGGRANVRQVLYMAAMSASNWNPALKLFHDRLKGAGKLPKVVIVAVMRKMITTLNAMVRDDTCIRTRQKQFGERPVQDAPPARGADTLVSLDHRDSPYQVGSQRDAEATVVVRLLGRAWWRAIVTVFFTDNYTDKPTAPRAALEFEIERLKGLLWSDPADAQDNASCRRIDAPAAS